MTDLDRRLGEGPLRVQSLWSARQTAELPARVLRLRRRRAVTLIGSLTSVVIAACVLLWFGTRPPSAAPEASQKAPTLDASAIVLGDGSRIRPLGESRVSVERDTPHGVLAQVVSGSADFDVSPKPARVFEVQAGRVRVRVIGTAFTVGLEAERTRVAVSRGKVSVIWPGGEEDLAAGGSGLYPPPPEPASAVAPDSTPETTAEASRWRELAKKGDYGAAYRELSKRPKSVSEEPGDLMLAADVARLSRHPDQAVAPLRKVFERFPGDARAPLAAFTLGRVLIENLGEPGSAADAFASAYRLAPSGPLATDALAREIEARAAAGQSQRAKELARRFVTLYPRSRQHEKLEKLGVLE